MRLSNGDGHTVGEHGRIQLVDESYSRTTGDRTGAALARVRIGCPARNVRTATEAAAWLGGSESHDQRVLEGNERAGRRTRYGSDVARYNRQVCASEVFELDWKQVDGRWREAAKAIRAWEASNQAVEQVIRNGLCRGKRCRDGWMHDDSREVGGGKLPHNVALHAVGDHDRTADTAGVCPFGRLWGRRGRHVGYVMSR